MKKLIFTLLLVTVISLASNAQSRVGVGLAYGAEIESAGIGVNGEFAASSQINIAPSFIYYFKKDNVTWWELNGNINYIFSENSATIYGIAGLNLTGVSVDLSDFGGGKQSDSELGLNIGIGANFDTGGSLMPFAEAKYVLGNADQLSLFGGVRFPLN
ncbi:outer membrane protein [Ekhidna sp.]|uniref:outer membrane protein n=1 Tax=Ekhidna sp. TaxID=2608089 RepID=UPI003B509B6F